MVILLKLIVSISLFSKLTSRDRSEVLFRITLEKLILELIDWLLRLIVDSSSISDETLLVS